ncbi:MAG: acyltransferase family protein [Terrimonas sp.]|nr:acyltransferase family protein [Terrimonas sp.]
MKGRIENIQHLRGIAAMMVVFVHFPTALQKFCGSIGVDLFFFISGFIIYISIERTGYYNRPLVFLKKRLLRIVPLYFAVLGLYLLMHLVLNSLRSSSIAPHYNIYDILKSFLFIPISENGVYKDPVVFLGWSLNFEMFFYLMTFTVLLVFRKKYFLPLLSLLILLPVTGLIAGGFENVYLDFFTSSFLFYFCIGLLIGHYQDRISNFFASFSEVIFFASVYVLFLVMLGRDYGYEHTGITREMVIYDHVAYQRFLIWGIPALFFFLSYFSISKKYNISNRFLNELGNRSYSIYLLQVFFIQVLYEIGYKFNETGIVFLSIILMALLVWVSGLSYKYFEKRFHA